MTHLIEDLRGGIVAVIRTDTPEAALEKATRAVERGACAVEVTWTVPDAVEVCRHLVQQQMTVGAGTLLRRRDAEDALSAGVTFLVAPVSPDFLVPLAREAGVLAIPAGATPSELYAAAQLGADLVKVFPAERLGGPAYVKDLIGPFPSLRLMCTGGVTLTSATDYLQAGAHCVGLSSLQ